MKLLTLARDLQRRKARERQHCFVAEGVRAVESLLDSPLDIVGLLAAESLSDDPRGVAALKRAGTLGLSVHTVSDDEFASAAGTEAPQGLLAIAHIPARELTAPPDVARYLVLDALQDPGNVGTVIRTAAALGVTATLALEGTVDLWNAKVVRSAMGALFSHPVIACSWESVATHFDHFGVACCVADVDGDDVQSMPHLASARRLALVVGNEGAGLSANVAERAAFRLTIRMAAGVESLNVAVATGILLHALRPI